MNNKELSLCCRRGLLAYVYTGVSVLVSTLVVGKWLLYTTAQWPWPSRSDIVNGCCCGGIKNKELGLWCRHGLLAKYLAGVSVTTECLSGGKWLLYTMALWPWPSQSDIPFSLLKMSQSWLVLKITKFAFIGTVSMKSLWKTWDLTVLWDQSAF